MIYAVKVRQLHLVELCFLRGSYIQKATTTNFGTRQSLAALANYYHTYKGFCQKWRLGPTTIPSRYLCASLLFVWEHFLTHW